MALLEVKGINIFYDSIQALHDITISIEEGDLVALIGANGAGKTTTLNAISGIIRPSPGEIWYKDERIDKLEPQVIVAKGIVQVPEGRRVFPQLTVLENLKMGAYLRKNSTEIDEDLKKVYALFPRLRERKGQKAGNLSGGEHQMLAVGRALMAKPKLLLMDEPTLGLSPILCQGVAATIKEINSQGISVILVEQNARMALKLAKHGYVMETGRMALQGKGSELMNSDYVKKVYLGG